MMGRAGKCQSRCGGGWEQREAAAAQADHRRLETKGETIISSRFVSLHLMSTGIQGSFQASVQLVLPLSGLQGKPEAHVSLSN